MNETMKLNVKNYVGLMSSVLPSDVDLISCFLTNNSAPIESIRNNTSNLKANYGLESNKSFSNEIIGDIINDYGKDHNIDDIEAHIHKPVIIGGSDADYDMALRSVDSFKKKRGYETQPVVELDELGKSDLEAEQTLVRKMR